MAGLSVAHNDDIVANGDESCRVPCDGDTSMASTILGRRESRGLNASDLLLPDIEQVAQSHAKLSQEEITELRQRLLGTSNADTILHPRIDLSDINGLDNNLTHCPEPISRLLQQRQHQPEEEENNSMRSLGPEIPAWMHNRPFGTLDFVVTNDHTEDIGPLGDVAVSSQEHQLLEDLLSLLTGVEGTYITLAGGAGEQRRFIVDDSVERSVQALVHKVLPVCTQYALLVRFIEDHSEHHHGLVNHALAAALTTLLKDYLLLVVQLESQQRTGVLTLHRLWFYIEKTAPVMDMLAAVTQDIAKSGARGGAVLSLLHARVQSLTGCGKLQDMAGYLTSAAARPYFDMLRAWVSQGVIRDPYGEFMVQDSEAHKTTQETFDSMQSSSDYHGGNVDNYWQWRYSLVMGNVPSFLTPQADLILRTGKYLNVTRQSACSIDSVTPTTTHTAPSLPLLSYDPDEQRHVAPLEAAYSTASRTLLEHLVQDQHLVSRMRSLKQYFLLAQGDFISQLLCLCEAELSKPLDDVLPHRLEFLLELALRTSNGAGSYQDAIHTVLLPYTLMDQMMRILSIETTEEQEHRHALSRLDLTGIEGFSLGCSVPWPASLVLDTRTLFCYQMLFRHLFYCKHVERQLCKVWLSNKGGKRLPLKARRSYTAAFLLRQRMLAFVQNIEYYMMFEVIERHWHQFLADMEKVESVDDVLQQQSHYLDKCLKDCLLTSPDLLRTLTKITNICAAFAAFILKSDLRYNAECPLSASESFEQTIARYDIQFSGMLVTLMDKVVDIGRQDYTDAIVNILYRLDFNKYYSERKDGISCLGDASVTHVPVDPLDGGTTEAAGKSDTSPTPLGTSETCFVKVTVVHASAEAQDNYDVLDGTSGEQGVEGVEKVLHKMSQTKADDTCNASVTSTLDIDMEEYYCEGVKSLAEEVKDDTYGTKDVKMSTVETSVISARAACSDNLAVAPPRGPRPRGSLMCTCGAEPRPGGSKMFTCSAETMSGDSLTYTCGAESRPNGSLTYTCGAEHSPDNNLTYTSGAVVKLADNVTYACGAEHWPGDSLMFTCGVELRPGDSLTYTCHAEPRPHDSLTCTCGAEREASLKKLATDRRAAHSATLALAHIGDSCAGVRLYGDITVSVGAYERLLCYGDDARLGSRIDCKNTAVERFNEGRAMQADLIDFSDSDKELSEEITDPKILEPILTANFNSSVDSAVSVSINDSMDDDHAVAVNFLEERLDQTSDPDDEEEDEEEVHQEVPANTPVESDPSPIFPSEVEREPRDVDLLIGHTSASGSSGGGDKDEGDMNGVGDGGRSSRCDGAINGGAVTMDLCYLRDKSANVEYTLVRRHLCCGNYSGHDHRHYTGTLIHDETKAKSRGKRSSEVSSNKTRKVKAEIHIDGKHIRSTASKDSTSVVPEHSKSGTTQLNGNKCKSESESLEAVIEIGSKAFKVGCVASKDEQYGAKCSESSYASHSQLLENVQYAGIKKYQSRSLEIIYSEPIDKTITWEPLNGMTLHQEAVPATMDLPQVESVETQAEAVAYINKAPTQAGTSKLPVSSVAAFKHHDNKHAVNLLHSGDLPAPAYLFELKAKLNIPLVDTPESFAKVEKVESPVTRVVCVDLTQVESHTELLPSRYIINDPFVPKDGSAAANICYDSPAHESPYQELSKCHQGAPLPSLVQVHDNRQQDQLLPYNLVVDNPVYSSIDPTFLESPQFFHDDFLISHLNVAELQPSEELQYEEFRHSLQEEEQTTRSLVVTSSTSVAESADDQSLEEARRKEVHDFLMRSNVMHQRKKSEPLCPVHRSITFKEQVGPPSDADFKVRPSSSDLPGAHAHSKFSLKLNTSSSRTAVSRSVSFARQQHFKEQLEKQRRQYRRLSLFNYNMPQEQHHKPQCRSFSQQADSFLLPTQFHVHTNEPQVSYFEQPQQVSHKLENELRKSLPHSQQLQSISHSLSLQPQPLSQPLIPCPVHFSEEPLPLSFSPRLQSRILSPGLPLSIPEAFTPPLPSLAHSPGLHHSQPRRRLPSPGFPHQYSSRLAEQLRQMMHEESRQLRLLQQQDPSALMSRTVDRNVEQDVQSEIEALERSLHIKEHQLRQLEEMQMRIQLEQDTPPPAHVRGGRSDENNYRRRQCQSLGEIEMAQLTVGATSSPFVIKKTRSEPLLSTPSTTESDIINGINEAGILDEYAKPSSADVSESGDHMYANWTAEPHEVRGSKRSSRAAVSSSGRTSSTATSSRTYSSEVMQQLQDLRMELFRAEEAIQQRLDRVCGEQRRFDADLESRRQSEKYVALDGDSQGTDEHRSDRDVLLMQSSCSSPSVRAHDLKLVQVHLARVERSFKHKTVDGSAEYRPERGGYLERTFADASDGHHDGDPDQSSEHTYESQNLAATTGHSMPSGGVRRPQFQDPEDGRRSLPNISFNAAFRCVVGEASHNFDDGQANYLKGELNGYNERNVIHTHSEENIGEQQNMRQVLDAGDSNHETSLYLSKHTYENYQFEPFDPKRDFEAAHKLLQDMALSETAQVHQPKCHSEYNLDKVPWESFTESTSLYPKEVEGVKYYPATVYTELKRLNEQLADTERMLTQRLDELSKPRAVPAGPLVSSGMNRHSGNIPNNYVICNDNNNNNSSLYDSYPHLHSVKSKPQTSAVKEHQPVKVSVLGATPTTGGGKSAAHSSQEDDGNDSSLCFAHIKKFWEKDKP